MYYRKGCTSVFIGKDASATGSPIYCHLEDNGIDDAVYLIYFPRVKSSEETLKLSHVEVPQRPETFAYWAIVLAPETPMSKDAVTEAAASPWVLCGMNEYGMSIGANGVVSKEPLSQKKGLSFFEVNKIALERAKNAEEATKIIGQLAEEYGQMGMGTNNAYCIGGSDGNWIVEVAARNWAAQKCPDDNIAVYANQYLIDTRWDFASADLVDYAKRQGWYNPASDESFSFRRSYGKDLDALYNALREERLRKLLGGKVGRITLQDVIAVTRDHYEGAEQSVYTTIDKGTSKEPYAYLPHKSPYRTICVPRTQASMVCTVRNDMPIDIGGLMWLCMSSPCTSIYMPIYAGSSRVPKEYSVGGGKYDSESAWWNFDMLQRLVDDYVVDRKEVRETFDRYEKRAFEQQKEFEKTVLEVYKQDPTLARELQSEHTYNHLSTAAEIARIIVSQNL
jgi:dipeptidase